MLVEMQHVSRVDHNSVDVFSHLRMRDDLLDFGTAIGMVEKEDPWNEVRDSSSSKVLGDKAQSLEMIGCQETADILLDLRRKSIHGEIYCGTRL
jgi:hypothetical protein